MNTHRHRPSQRGVALAVALILLVLITLLALSGIRLSTLELRMALNDEIRVDSFEQAQSLVDATIRPFTNTPVLAPGTVICAREVTGTCTGGNVRLDLPSDYDDELAGQFINVLISGIPPLNAKPPVGTGFSITAFNAAYLRVQGMYEMNAQGKGQAYVNEGIAVVYAAPGDVVTETNVNTLAGE